MWALKPWVHQILHKTSNKDRVMIEWTRRELIRQVHGFLAQNSKLLDFFELVGSSLSWVGEWIRRSSSLMLLIPIWETPLNKALWSSKQTPQSVLCHGTQIAPKIRVSIHDLAWPFLPWSWAWGMKMRHMEICIIQMMYMRVQSDQAQRKRVGCGDDEGAKVRMKEG